MPAFLTSPRSVKSQLARLSVGAIVAIGFAAGSGPAVADAKGPSAQGIEKRAVAGHVLATAAGHKAKKAKKAKKGQRATARAAGRKIG